MNRVITMNEAELAFDAIAYVCTQLVREANPDHPLDDAFVDHVNSLARDIFMDFCEAEEIGEIEED